MCFGAFLSFFLTLENVTDIGKGNLISLLVQLLIILSLCDLLNAKQPNKFTLFQMGRLYMNILDRFVTGVLKLCCCSVSSFAAGQG